MLMRVLIALAATAALCTSLFPGIVVAEVVESTTSGFLVRNVVVVHASPDSAYRALVGRVGDWWSPAHTFSGNAHNLAIDARPGGCFCEQLPNGGVRHLEVVYADPGRVLRLVGGLGPLQACGVAGSMSFAFAPRGDSTAIEMSYSVGGYCRPSVQALASPVDGVLREQLERLKNLIETGNPVAR